MSLPERHIHIISFDVPYPPNYGGVIDVFFKIRALHAKGIKVHLHSFQYGREQAKVLNKYCFSVNYYARNVAKSLLFMKQPYIVISRNSENLIEELLKDDHPILFEGIHTCNFLNDERIADRIKIVRTHNIEHDYYIPIWQKLRVIFSNDITFIMKLVNLKHLRLLCKKRR